MHSATELRAAQITGEGWRELCKPKEDEEDGVKEDDEVNTGDVEDEKEGIDVAAMANLKLNEMVVKDDGVKKGDGVKRDDGVKKDDEAKKGGGKNKGGKQKKDDAVKKDDGVKNDEDNSKRHAI